MRTSPAVALAVTAGLLLSATAGPSWAQTPAGGEFRVNTYTTGNQFHSVVGRDDQGDFVVVWDDRRTSIGRVLGQRYDRTGTAVGGEFQVNTYTTLATYFPSVTMAPGGEFVVMWGEFRSNGTDVVAQRFDAAGNRAGAEFQLNLYTTGTQLLPQGAQDAAGNLIVTWLDVGRDGSFAGIFAQRFSATNDRLGAEFQVNTNTVGDQTLNSVAMDPAGSFIIAWTDATDGSGESANARIYDPGGNTVGGEFLVGATTTGSQKSPVPLYAPDGSIVVAFEQGDGNGRGVAARRFSATGAPLGSQFQVNTYTTGDQRYPFLDFDSVGNFVVQWNDLSGDGSGEAIKGRRYTAGGVPRSGEFSVNTYTTGAQSSDAMTASIASDQVGNFVITWHSPQDGSSNGIYAQRYGGIHPAALSVDASGNRVLDPGETAAFAPSWFNANGAPQALGGALTDFAGPSGAVYTIADPSAAYGVVPNDAAVACTDCYTIGVSNPTSRPAPHWDAAVTETLTPDSQGQAKRWTVHVGGSFTDVSAASGFYRFIETLFHRGITGGCTATEYCPLSSTTREQMAVFVLAAKGPPGFVPPACTTPVFADVPASSPFCRWIEELARRGVVAGCGGGNYCPQDPVTREQMAVFVLRTLDGTLTPPACSPPNLFADVPETSPFCRWIEELANRGVVTGCGGGNYCPLDPVTREQMGVFISVTFGLTLYGP